MDEKVKILLVEDDPMMSRLFQRGFSLQGFDAQVAGNGLEGVEKAKAMQPAIILLDVMMPKMNGLQVLAKLKSDPDTKSIPVMMLTNLAGEKDAENALMKGAVKYIVKSEHDPKQVVGMVKEIIAAHSRDDVPGS